MSSSMSAVKNAPSMSRPDRRRFSCAAIANSRPMSFPLAVDA